MKVSLYVGVLILILGVIGFSIYISKSNAEIELRNQFGAQQENCKIVYDETWKVLKQMSGITDRYAEDFKGIYTDLMEKRYGNGGGGLMKWIQERNPDFDSSLYTKLQNAIEAKRGEFTREQRRLLDIKRTHDNMIMTFPGSVLLSGRERLEAQIVTSSKTKQVFEDGEENDIEL